MASKIAAPHDATGKDQSYLPVRQVDEHKLKKEGGKSAPESESYASFSNPRRLNRKHWLPSASRRKAEYAIRTAYTTLVMMIINYYREINPVSGYLANLIAPISAFMYLGLWQANCFKIIVGTVIGASLGVLIGLTWTEEGYVYSTENSPGLRTGHLLALFAAMFITNKFSGPMWVGPSKALCGLAILLGWVYPVVSNGAMTPKFSFITILTIQIVPYLITGATLLFPFPALAIDAAKELSGKIAFKLNSINTAAIRGFCSKDFVTFYNSEIEILTREISDAILTLETLQVHTTYEIILFPNAKSFPDKLASFIGFSKSLLADLKGLHYTLKNIKMNTTHEKFVQVMHENLLNIESDIAISLRLLSEEINEVDWYWNWHRWISSCISSRWSSLDANVDDRTKGDLKSGANVGYQGWIDGDIMISNRTHSNTNDIELADIIDKSNDNSGEHKLESITREIKFKQAVARLRQSQRALLEDARNVRQNFVWKQTEAMVKACSNTGNSNFRDIYRFRFNGQNELVKFLSKSNIDTNDDSSTPSTPNTIKENRDLSQIMDENQQFRNLSPRGAYLQRLFNLFHTLESASIIYEIEGSYWSPMNFIKTSYFFLIEYAYTWFVELFAFPLELIKYFISNDDNFRDYFAAKVKTYIHPFKISLAITLTALLVVVPGDNSANGLWAVAVITLIRQDSATLSFNMGYQRLEGTVVGCIFSFFWYRVLQCEGLHETETCNFSQKCPIIVLWILFCAFFREGARHGYAAMVAGFTPIVLLQGPTIGDLVGAFKRIEKTFYGVAIYVIIDNLVLPSWSSTIIRENLISISSSTSIMLNNSFTALNLVFRNTIFGTNSAVSRSDRSGSISGGEKTSTNGDNLSLVHIDDPLPGQKQIRMSEREITETFTNCLTRATESAVKLQKGLDVFSTHMKNVVFEPDYLQRSFPISNFQRVLDSLNDLLLAGRSLISSALAIDIRLRDMRAEGLDVDAQYKGFNFMHKHLVVIAEKVASSLSKSEEAIKSMYLKSNFEKDITDLLTMNRFLEGINTEIDNYYKFEYANKILGTFNVDIAFLTAEQNVIESVFQVINCLTQLGLDIRSLRDAEWQNSL